jgi:hypothetical protein
MRLLLLLFLFEGLNETSHGGTESLEQQEFPTNELSIEHPHQQKQQQQQPHIIYITFNDDNVPGSPFVVNLSDIEEKEDDYDSTGVRGRNVHIPPTGEVDNHLSHQLQDANKNITKAMMHDNMSSSHFYSNTTHNTKICAEL